MAKPSEQIPESVLQEWAEYASKPTITRGWDAVVACAILGTFCVIVVCTRLWLKVIVQRKPDLSDLFTFIALIFTLGVLVSSCLCLKLYGMDHHLWNLTMIQLRTLMKITWIDVLLTALAECFARLSILLFYRNIVKNHPTKKFMTTLWVIFALSAMTSVACTIAVFCACQPLNAFWNQYDPNWNESYTCNSHGGFVISASAIGAVLDVVISLLPITVLWHMQIPRAQKIGIWVLFSMGLFACVAAVLRIYWAAVAFYETYDYTWNAYGMLLWTCIECPLALIGSSLPALKALFLRFQDKRKQSRNTSSERSQFSDAQTPGSSKQRSLPSDLRTLCDDDKSDFRYTVEEWTRGDDGMVLDVLQRDHMEGAIGGANDRSTWVISKSVTISTEYEEHDGASLESWDDVLRVDPSRRASKMHSRCVTPVI